MWCFFVFDSVHALDYLEDAIEGCSRGDGIDNEEALAIAEEVSRSAMRVKHSPVHLFHMMNEQSVCGLVR